MAFAEYPKWLFHSDGRSTIVQSLDGELALGPGWGPTPAGPFHTPETVQQRAGDAEGAVLADLEANPGSQVAAIAERLGQPREDIQRCLDALFEAGRIEKGPFGRYQVLPTQDDEDDADKED